MRVVWKDSFLANPKPIKYRGHYATMYKGGWIIDVPGDNNIYKNNYCAMNAIDKALGGTGVRGAGSEKRRKHGVQIVGVKDE